MPIAITRQVSPNLSHCELTHLDREAINVQLAQKQHWRYETALAKLGCELHSLPAEPMLPDSVFVEDAAVVLDEVAVITRLGAASRRAETASISTALARYREIVRMTEPATLDGGDVLRVGKTLYVGLSSRTNLGGIDQLRSLLKPWDYRIIPIEIRDCLHLKSAISQVSEDCFLVNRSWIKSGSLPDAMFVEVDPTETHAANALLIDQTVLFPSQYPETHRRLKSKGIEVKTVDLSELTKAEGGVTCCSLMIH